MTTMMELVLWENLTVSSLVPKCCWDHEVSVESEAAGAAAVAAGGDKVHQSM